MPDSDIAALLRRADADNDDELSFADFFSTLLPYFIFGIGAKKAEKENNSEKKKRFNSQ